MPLSALAIAHELTRRYPNQSFASGLDKIEIQYQRTSDVDIRSKIVRSLLGHSTILHLDIGSRSGPKPEIDLFGEFFKIILCEPDNIEAEELRARGYETIERAFWSQSGNKLKLNVHKAASNSSVLEPELAWMKFWLGDLRKLNVERVEEIQTTTINDEEHSRKIRFDDLKIDAEGADYEILKGLGKSQPMFIQSEVNTVKLRRRQGLLHDISELLFDRGYFLADINFRRFNGAALNKQQRRSSRGIGLTGDAYYLPDWMRKKGRDIIERSPTKWAAVMIIKGYEDLLRWICTHEKWECLSEIRTAILQDVECS